LWRKIKTGSTLPYYITVDEYKDGSAGISAGEPFVHVLSVDHEKNKIAIHIWELLKKMMGNL
jgi:hypothetical protein